MATASTSGSVRYDPKSGIIESIAGIGEQGAAPDGTPASKAQFTFFGGMVYTKDGDLIFTSLDHRILKLEAKTRMHRVIGGTGQSGFAGDGGPAAAAQFNTPYGIAITPAGDLIVADASNRRVRKIDGRSGVVTTIAGPGWVLWPSVWSTDSHVSRRALAGHAEGRARSGARCARPRRRRGWSDEQSENQSASRSSGVLISDRSPLHQLGFAQAAGRTTCQLPPGWWSLRSLLSAIPARAFDLGHPSILDTQILPLLVFNQRSDSAYLRCGTPEQPRRMQAPCVQWPTTWANDY